MRKVAIQRWGDTAAGALAVVASIAGAACPSQFSPGEIFESGENKGMCVAADIDGDGALDLTTGATVMLGDGAGGFKETAAFPWNGIPGWDALVADFDGDGRSDVALALCDEPLVPVFFGRARESAGQAFLEPPVIVPCVTGGWHFACGDVDANGTLDIVVGSMTQPMVSVLLNNGDRTFQSLTHEGMPQPTQALALADFDGDGHLDIASGNGTAAVLLFGHGDGTFGGLVVSPLLFRGTPVVVHRLRAADFDGDGRAELVACLATGLVVYPGRSIERGTGLTPGSNAAYGLDGSGRFVELADMSCDGLLDMVVLWEKHMKETKLRVLCSQPPTLEEPVAFTEGDAFPVESTTTPPLPPFDMMVHALGDMNGDGAIDILVISEFTGKGRIFFGAQRCAPTGSGDANGDGMLNIADAVAVLAHLFAHKPAPCPNVLEVNGDGTLNIADAVYVLTHLFAHGPAPLGAPRPCGGA